MADKPPTKEDDLVKAREIVAEYGLLIGPAGKHSEVVAQAVADGIAAGRKEGMALAAKAIARLEGKGST